MRNVRPTFLPSFFPRFWAAFWVIVIMGGLSVACILGVALVGPALGHGENIDHAAGQIVSIGPGKDFVLLTATGKRMAFQCGAECRASLGHMQRHEVEHAHTDVYYTKGSSSVLMALDVD